MKTINKVLILLVTIGVAAIAAFALSAPAVTNSEQIKITDTIQTEVVSSAPSPDNGAQIGYKGHVTIYKTEAKTGITTLVADKDNLLMNSGKRFIQDKLNAVDVNASNRTLAISLASNGTTPDASWSQISDELTTLGFVRNTTGTYTLNGTSGGYNVSSSWTATDTKANIQLTGLHWNNLSASDGNLFAALQFTNQSLLINDRLDLVWQITIS